MDYNDITCRKYELDKNNLIDDVNEENDFKYNKALLTQKLNKPFMISIGKDDISLKFEEQISNENYICVEPFTNIVINSKINFIFSLYTKKYGYINSKIENDKIYPIFIYEKNYEVDIESFNEYFPSINQFYTFKMIFLIIGIILILALTITALFFFMKLHKTLIEEDIQKNGPDNQKLIDSREPTIMNRSQNKD